MSPGPHSRRRAPLAREIRCAWLCLLAAGCTTEVLIVDPPVDYQDEQGYVLEGDPRLTLGYYREQLYTPLEEGGECTIVPNPQGGHWTSPTIRAGGIGAEVRIVCSLVSAAGEPLSETRERRHMVLAAEGLIEAPNVPMFVERADVGARVEDLFGGSAVLQCRVIDEEGREATTAVRCVLQPGTG